MRVATKINLYDTSGKEIIIAVEGDVELVAGKYYVSDIKIDNSLLQRELLFHHREEIISVIIAKRKTCESNS